ncbi:MAG: helix-turn-helix domain-containing protein, partial [Halobacteria archaeon]|nr:helix-turn-helix domain-containing protein [Halobacteria archaeon]
DEITELEVLEEHGNEALVQFRTTNPLILFAARDSGVPLETPFEIQNGEGSWDVTAPHERISELGSQLDMYGIDYGVEYVKEVEFENLLTERQKKVITEAVDRGYYDTPRDCSLTQLADSMGIAKSTCSEILHRAEEKVVKEFVDNVRPTVSGNSE